MSAGACGDQKRAPESPGAEVRKACEAPDVGAVDPN